MLRKGGRLALYAPLVPLLLVFLGPLAYVLAKTSALERDMRIAATENMLWVVTQTQMELLALTLAAASPERDADTITRRYDLTLSRLNLVREGPQARYLERLGQAAAVQDIHAQLLALDPLIQGHGPAQHDALYRLGLSLHPQLNRIANDVMMREWEMSAARLDDHRASQRLVLLAVTCAFVAALAVSWVLLRNQLRLHRAEVQRLRTATLLKQERDTSALYRDFAAMVSHQMRTPLSLIDSAMHRLARRGEQVTARDVAERQKTVRDATQRLTRLVDTVLLLGRLDNDQLHGSFAPVGLDTLADAALSEARTRFNGRQVKLSCAPGDLTALCDPHLVAHILDNLLSNALKYSPAGRPVEARVFAQGGQVACAITDQGPGIAPRDQPQVFERYFRGEGQKAGPGIGLGLALAQELAQLQGGRVTMDTWPGKGSVFTLWLPAAAVRT